MKLSVVGTEASTLVGLTVIVHVPSGGATTLTIGEELRAVRVPELLERSWVENVALPRVVGGVTRAAPPPAP